MAAANAAGKPARKRSAKSFAGAAVAMKNTRVYKAGADGSACSGQTEEKRRKGTHTARRFDAGRSHL